METKVCNKCNMDLPLSNYYNRNSKCKECYKEEYKKTKGAEVAERKRLKKVMLEEKGVKECSVCKLELPLSNFKKNNKGNYIYCCRGCSNEKQKERHLQKKIENGYVVKPKLIVKDGFKICNECKLELPISEFHIKNKDRGSYECKCKKCRYKYKKGYMEKYISIPENKDKMRENRRAYEKKRALKVKIIRDNLKVEKQRLIENKRIEKEKQDLIWEEKKRMIAYKKTDEYRIEQDKRNKERRYERFKFRFNNDELFALKKRLRNLIRGSFRKSGYTNFKARTEEIVGISFNEFKVYMESKFVDGMNWGNRDLWHIDHIIPLSTAKSEQELIALSHYTNLQPLWAMDNLKKGNKILV